MPKKSRIKKLKNLREKYKTIFLSIEKPKDEISKIRQNFYLRNVFLKKINIMM